LYQKQLLNRHTRTAVVRAGKDGEIAATKLVDAAKLEKKYSPCLFMQSADSSEEIKQAPNQYANLVRALRLHGG
jgi:hypothetical protein